MDQKKINEDQSSSYTCKECEFQCDSNKNLIHHWRITHRYTCGPCCKSFPTKSGYEYHMLEHTNERPFKCNECGKYYKSEHKAIHSVKETDYLCELCEKSFVQKAYLTVHKHNQHKVKDEPILCTYCGKCFQSKLTLLNHELIHIEKPFLCEICKRTFPEEVKLAVHKIRYSKETPVKCKECDVVCHSQSMLSSHKRTHFKEVKSECKQCFKSFKNLRKHMRLAHSDEKKIKCDKCPKTFKRLDLCKYHKFKYHPLKCDNCVKVFIRDSDLEAHKKSHLETTTTFACDECEEKFSYQELLEMHKKVVHPIIKEPTIYEQRNKLEEEWGNKFKYHPLKCDNCEKVFIRDSDLEAHKKSHLETTTTFACDECEEKFSHQELLQMHKKVAHPIIKEPTIHKQRKKLEEEWGKNLKCNKCDKLFEMKNKLIDHYIKTHIDHLNCKKCNVLYENESKLNDHITKVHPNQLKCKDCGEIFPTYDLLKDHRKVHVKRAAHFPCSRTEEPLSEHSKVHRKVHVKSDAFFPCDRCDRFFTKEKLLSEHSKVHLDWKPYKCDICGSSFKTQTAFKSHMLIHKQKEVIPIEKIGKKYNTTDNKLPCDICGKIFKQINHLTLHKKKIHEKKMHKKKMHNEQKTMQNSIESIIKIEPEEYHEDPTLFTGTEMNIKIEPEEIAEDMEFEP